VAAEPASRPPAGVTRGQAVTGEAGAVTLTESLTE
jgi:hypothetical protein